jgi:acyl-CoA dehydrogenase
VTRGIDFALSEGQQALRALARNCAEAEIRPRAIVCDRDGSWPGDVVERMWEVGVLNPSLSQEHGGPGLGNLEVALIAEEISWGCTGFSTIVGANALAIAALSLGGSDSLKRCYLGRLAEAPRVASFALTEPGVGSDVSGLATRATREDGGWRIRGEKTFISNATHADWYVVFARTGEERGHRGISAFVVPRGEGVEVSAKLDKLGQRASDTAALTFDALVGDDHLLGALGGGFALAMRTLDRTRPGVAAQGVGLARAAWELAASHALETEEQGLPLAAQQSIAFALADMSTTIEAARLLVWQAAWLLDQGRPATLASSHAKRFACDSAMTVASQAVDVLGPAGTLRERQVEKLMRDAKLLQIYEGTSQIQRLVIARKTLEPLAARLGEIGKQGAAEDQTNHATK